MERDQKIRLLGNSTELLYKTQLRQRHLMLRQMYLLLLAERLPETTQKTQPLLRLVNWGRRLFRHHWLSFRGLLQNIQ